MGRKENNLTEGEKKKQLISMVNRKHKVFRNKSWFKNHDKLERIKVIWKSERNI